MKKREKKKNVPRRTILRGKKLGKTNKLKASRPKKNIKKVLTILKKESCEKAACLKLKAANFSRWKGKDEKLDKNIEEI